MASRLLAAGLALAAGLLAACDDATPPEQQPASTDASAVGRSVLPDHFPADFPVPDEVVPGAGGDSAGFAVGDDPTSVLSFYRQQLKRGGWELGDDWEGVDPQGRETRGLTFAREGLHGALAISRGERYPSVVQVTLTTTGDDPQGR